VHPVSSYCTDVSRRTVNKTVKKGCIFSPVPLRSYPDIVRYKKYFGRNFQNFWNCCSGFFNYDWTGRQSWWRTAALLHSEAIILKRNLQLFSLNMKNQGNHQG